MPMKDIIVIGASAGGIDALQRLCAALPAGFPASVFIAQHLSPSARSVLPQLLDRVSPCARCLRSTGRRSHPGISMSAAPTSTSCCAKAGY